MKDHDREKRAMERAAIRLFVDRYNRTAPTRLRFMYLQEKPDAVLMDPLGRKIGMEITHLFYDDVEARMLLGKSDIIPHEEERFSHLLAELNERIWTKEQKKQGYSPDYPISLLIRNVCPAFGYRHFAQAKERVYRPSEAFEGIWLLSRDDHGEWHLLDLKQPSSEGKAEQP